MGASSKCQLANGGALNINGAMYGKSLNSCVQDNSR
jgi:hypothetical protein